MIKMRVEFLNKKDLEEILKTLENTYVIADQGEIKESKKQGSKFKIIYIELVKK